MNCLMLLSLMVAVCSAAYEDEGHEEQTFSSSSSPNSFSSASASGPGATTFTNSGDLPAGFNPLSHSFPFTGGAFAPDTAFAPAPAAAPGSEGESVSPVAFAPPSPVAIDFSPNAPATLLGVAPASAFAPPAPAFAPPAYAPPAYAPPAYAPPAYAPPAYAPPAYAPPAYAPPAYAPPVRRPAPIYGLPSF